MVGTDYQPLVEKAGAGGNVDQTRVSNRNRDYEATWSFVTPLIPPATPARLTASPSQVEVEWHQAFCSLITSTFLQYQFKPLVERGTVRVDSLVN